MNIDELIAQVRSDKYKVICFGVFNTLILRPVIRSGDMNVLLGRKLGKAFHVNAVEGVAGAHCIEQDLILILFAMHCRTGVMNRLLQELSVKYPKFFLFMVLIRKWL